MFHVNFSRVKPAIDCGYVGDKLVESWSKNGENYQRVKSEKNREIKLIEDRVICGKCIEECVDRKKRIQSAKHTLAIWCDDEQTNST